METIETDLKYTVLLVCEEVPDLRVSSNDVTADAAEHEKETTATASVPPPEAAKGNGEMPFLAGTEDFYRLKCRLSDGDSIPRSDSTLLRVPVSQREMEKEKKSAKKAIKMKIKKFKKGGSSACFPLLLARLSGCNMLLTQSCVRRNVMHRPPDGRVLRAQRGGAARAPAHDPVRRRRRRGGG